MANDKDQEMEEDRDDFDDIRHELNLDEDTIEEALETYQKIKGNFKLEVSVWLITWDFLLICKHLNFFKGQTDGLDCLCHLLFLPKSSHSNYGSIEGDWREYGFSYSHTSLLQYQVCFLDKSL